VCQNVVAGIVGKNREFPLLQCKGVEKMTSVELKHQAKAEVWRKRIVDCRGSGMTVREWCQENQVCVTTYYRWEREILGHKPEDDSRSQQMSSVAPVFATLPAPQREISEKERPVATVRIGGASVDIYSNTDNGLVTALIQALKSC
jgi:hypothetical protein